MILEAIPQTFEYVYLAVKSASLRSSSFFLVCLIFVLLYTLWLLWRFTVIPLIRPNEPRNLPYSIPWLGHAVGLFKDTNGVITYGRKYFGDTREPFIITVAGQSLCMLTSPGDITTVYKNTTNLPFDDLVKEIYTFFEVSPAGIDKMWHPFPESSSSSSSQLGTKSLAIQAHDLHHTQLLPGENLEAITNIFLRCIEENTRWDRIPLTSIIKSSTESKIISLHAWCRDVIVDAATRAFFGDRLPEMAPDLAQHFCTFDDHSWMMMYRYPRFLATDTYSAKEKVIDALEAYFDLPVQNRPGAAYYIRTMEAKQRQIGLSNRDIAKVAMMMYWVTNTNAYKITFWLLTYILRSPSLISTIRTEIAPAFQPQSSSPLSINFQQLINSCPVLNSCFAEAHRLASSAISVRNVLAPTVIGNRTLTPGTKVFMPYRQLHFDTSVYGPNPSEFDHERFLRDKNLEKSPSYRPFGGGTTYCSGRFIARREVLTFVAVVLWRYNIEVLGPRESHKTSPGKGFPRMDERKPCLGIIGPMKGDDVVLKITTKDTWTIK